MKPVELEHRKDVHDQMLVCLDFGCVNSAREFYRKYMIGQALGIAQDDRQEYRQAQSHAMQTHPNRDHTPIPKEEVMAVSCQFGETF